MAASATRAVGLLLGKCIPSVKTNASKICVSKMELDTNLNMYFKNMSFLYAHDPDKMCKAGDIVLVEQLPAKLTKLITHKVIKIVYPLGDITDPITGKKVVCFDYRDDIEDSNKIYGENKDTFDYDNAPPRGWQEGIKDFSDKKTYIKYHEVPGKDEPYAH